MMESETGLEKAFSVLPTVTECVCVSKEKRRRRKEHVVSLCGAQEVRKESVSERASQRESLTHREAGRERASQREPHRETQPLSSYIKT